jgi:transcriptional regulator with XRE-family HTH domain
MDALRFGRQFRALRIRQNKRQADVASASSVSRSLVATIDRGQLGGVTLGSLTAVAAALGAEVDIRLRWRGEQLDRLLDEEHAAVVEAVVNRLKRRGWVVEVEASFSIWGERGSVDVLAYQPRFGSLLIVEAKSMVPDSQAMIHGLDRKARLGRRLAEDRGWQVRHTSRLLAIASSATARRRIQQLHSTYGAALPARGATVRGFLVRPESPIRGLVFVSIDSQLGLRRRSPGRQRVRPRRSAQSTITAPVGANPGRGSTGSPPKVDEAGI